jgi:mono/diheme cytochrome c family protein/glucose/arabinose dehydrogenase
MPRQPLAAHAALPLIAILVASGVVRSQQTPDPNAAALRNPVATTPAAIAAGKKAYDENCAACHGPKAEGSVKAGVPISIIQEQGGKQPPDLTDAAWDHGSSDGEIFTAIKKGLPPTMMAGWEGRISDTEMWSIVTYLRALAAGTVTATPAATAAVAAAPRPTLELVDYLQMPITGDLAGKDTRAQLARINFMREEPGGRRFFITDLNGPLYILDKQTKALTTYLDFNGTEGHPGLFARLTFQRNFATGLINVVFDPDYARNGVFYTIHMEDPTIAASAEPKAGVVPGLDVAGYRTTPAFAPPKLPDQKIIREGVLVEWTDRTPANATFEGTARELLRIELSSPIHPLGEMTFNPTARRGDPDWRVMYVGVGDAGTGEQKDMRRLNPQRLDTVTGKILRIVPDLRDHVATSTVSGNGRYRIPTDNPFVAIDGALKEIWAAGLRNPHRMIWDVESPRSKTPRLIAFNIGLTNWESAFVVTKGANFGYPLREGTQAMTPQGMTDVPADDTIPVQISDTVTRGTTTPIYPVIAYRHVASGGDAIAGGVIYHGRRIPALKGKLVFGDITTGRIWYAEMGDVHKADDGVATTLAPMHELDAGLRALVERTFRARGAQGDALPGAAAVSGRGRVDLRFADDNTGELYVLTKTDGMIRRVVALKPAAAKSEP